MAQSCACEHQKTYLLTVMSCTVAITGFGSPAIHSQAGSIQTAPSGTMASVPVGTRGGAWDDAPGIMRMQVMDEAMEEAVREHVHAQQMMAIMRHPAVYKELGLKEPPTSYTPGFPEEAWANVRLLLSIDTEPYANDREELERKAQELVQLQQHGDQAKRAERQP